MSPTKVGAGPVSPGPTPVAAPRTPIKKPKACVHLTTDTAKSNDTGSPCAEIPLPHGRVAIVDEADFEMLSQHRWVACGRYAQAWINGQTVVMHRLIMGLTHGDGLYVDHIDHNPLNNRRANLRVCTAAQNSAHSWRKAGVSGFRGVTASYWGLWNAHIWAKCVRYELGLFPDKEDAARAYDIAATEHFGEFAVLNFPAVAP